MLKKHLFPFGLIFILALLSYAPKNSIDGLHVTFKSQRQDYVLTQQMNSMTTMPYIEATEGMMFVKLKMKLENRGSSDCTFDVLNFYVSDNQDVLYPAYSYIGGLSSEKTLRPGKSTTPIVIFQFPNDSLLNDLYIEDKKYSVVFD